MKRAKTRAVVEKIEEKRKPDKFFRVTTSWRASDNPKVVRIKSCLIVSDAVGGKKGKSRVTLQAKKPERRKFFQAFEF
jgi:hypothetical protein